MMSNSSILHPNNCMQLLKITENAALACYHDAGFGDEKKADASAVNSIRHDLNQLPIDGTIIIGEGERDEAPMLYIGENIGDKKDLIDAEKIDIALDPLEGTTICAQLKPGSFSVICFAQQGVFLHAPDVYMEKIVVGANINPEGVSLNNTVQANLEYVRQTCNVKAEDLTVTILNRTRHQELITKIRTFGARVKLIDDGDISASIKVACNSDGTDIYMGIGGAPEGVISASALQAFGGTIKGKLLFANEQQKNKASQMGFSKFDEELTMKDFVNGDSIFCASGITDGDILKGIIKNKKQQTQVNSIITYSQHNIIRKITSYYKL